jgi:hypothetical protein
MFVTTLFVATLFVATLFVALLFVIPQGSAVAPALYRLAQTLVILERSEGSLYWLLLLPLQLLLPFWLSSRRDLLHLLLSLPLEA